MKFVRFNLVFGFLFFLFSFFSSPEYVLAGPPWDNLSPEGGTSFTFGNDVDMSFNPTVPNYDIFSLFNATTEEIWCFGGYPGGYSYWTLNGVNAEGIPGIVIRCGVPDGIYRLVNHDRFPTGWESAYFKVVNGIAYPYTPITISECCSSVAFIPGLQASRLYSADLGDKKLWEPFGNSQVQKLYLDNQGESIDQSIYTEDAVDIFEAFGGAGELSLYSSFFSVLNDMVSENIIQAWKPLPYDWRENVFDIARYGVKYKDSISDMVQEIETLAENSLTGRATIVAHSNGGLVTKALMIRLEEEGKTQLVDKIIFVAVPQLGTPDAVKALLHGMPLMDGLIVGGSTSRSLAENMPGAYGLLPTKKYFEAVTEPIIVFDPSAFEVDTIFNTYGSFISNTDPLDDFLRGVEGRTKPHSTDLNAPNVLNLNLLARARETHQVFDLWQPPAGIKLIQIAGWGIDTVKGIKYVGVFPCSKLVTLGPCAPYIKPQPMFTVEGDKTVVYPSAIPLDGEKYYFDVLAYNNEERTNLDHKNIFEASSINSFLENIIQNMTGMPMFINQTKPEPETEDKRIHVAMHSPATIDLYDGAGRHTGLVASGDPDFVFYEEGIPNSFYMELGEGKYAGFGAGTGNTVEIKGTGMGTFTFVVEERQGDEVVGAKVFPDIPVTPSLKATFVVSDTATLVLDIDGNGTDDFSVPSTGQTDPVLFLQILKQTVVSIQLPSDIEKTLLQKIDKAISFITKDKKEKAILLIKQFVAKLEEKEWGKIKTLTQEQSNILVEMIGSLVDNIK